MNFNYKKLINKLSKMNDDEKNILANNIVNKLNEISEEELENGNWSEVFETQINFSLFEHGLLANKGTKSYILSDYLKNNIFLIKSRKMCKILEDYSIFNISIDKDFNVNIESNTYGDRLVNLLDLNIISYFDKEFANNIFSKFVIDKNKNKSYKLFKFYTTKYCLDLIVFIEKNGNIKEEYENLLNYIFDSYDDFTLNKPKWLLV